VPKRRLNWGFFGKKNCLKYNALTSELIIQIQIRFFILVADINGFLCVNYELSQYIFHLTTAHNRLHRWIMTKVFFYPLFFLLIRKSMGRLLAAGNCHIIYVHLDVNMNITNERILLL
jgi:hypothetical protein